MVILGRVAEPPNGSRLLSYRTDGVRGGGRVLFDIHEGTICLVATSPDGLCSSWQLRDEFCVVVHAGELGVEVAYFTTRWNQAISESGSVVFGIDIGGIFGRFYLDHCRYRYEPASHL